jgi:hypothetical protein
MITVFLKLLNTNLDNEIVLYSTIIVVTGAIAFTLLKKTLTRSYVETGVQRWKLLR